MKKTSPLFLFIFLIVLSLDSFSQLRLPAILGSHMVLQQNSEVKLWGWSYAQEKITIKTDWDTITYRTVGSQNADWAVSIKTPAAGGPYKITISGYHTIVLDDVLIGEVWLGSGQSNMDWSAGGLKQGKEEAPNANNNKIRLFTVAKATAEYPQNDAHGSWKVCTPEEMKNFSAVGYFFAKKLQNELNIPVGIINSSWGGTAAEIWTPEEVIENNPSLLEASQKITTTWPGWPIKASYAYNAMIKPITNFNIAGVLWYQGESNTGASATYQPLLTGMISSWRKLWNKEFPFYLVQIAPHTYGTPDIAALLREAQTKISQTVPKTGMVVISDLVDDVKDIHPANKKDVGIRLANYALVETYGKKGISYKNPLYRSMKVEKNKVRVFFDNADSGLISKGALTEFFISGEDKKFVKAEAKIEKNTVVVWSKEVKKPVAVRFGFTNSSIPNLFGKNGLPVNLFRTDDWEVTTETK